MPMSSSANKNEPAAGDNRRAALGLPSASSRFRWAGGACRG